MAGDLRAKWTHWIEGPIADDILSIRLRRATWKTVQGLTEENGALPESYWWEFLFTTYSMTQAVGIRRQVDTDRRVASLGRLIREIAASPQVVTRESWLGLWDPASQEMVAHVAEPAWATQFGGGDSLDPEIPTAELKQLRKATKHVTTYVNEHVAHLKAPAPANHRQDPPEAPTRSPTTLTLNEVHDVIDEVGRMFRKYHNLLTANTYTDLVPVIQDGWLAVFRVPWIQSE